MTAPGVVMRGNGDSGASLGRSWSAEVVICPTSLSCCRVGTMGQLTSGTSFDAHTLAFLSSLPPQRQSSPAPLSSAGSGLALPSWSVPECPGSQPPRGPCPSLHLFCGRASDHRGGQGRCGGPRRTRSTDNPARWRTEIGWPIFQTESGSATR
jgi:hypothetical protein